MSVMCVDVELSSEIIFQMGDGQIIIPLAEEKEPKFRGVEVQGSREKEPQYWVEQSTNRKFLPIVLTQVKSNIRFLSLASRHKFKFRTTNSSTSCDTPVPLKDVFQMSLLRWPGVAIISRFGQEQ